MKIAYPAWNYIYVQNDYLIFVLYSKIPNTYLEFWPINVILKKLSFKLFEKTIFLSRVRIAYIPIHGFSNPASSRKEFIFRIYLRTAASKMRYVSVSAKMHQILGKENERKRNFEGDIKYVSYMIYSYLLFYKTTSHSSYDSLHSHFNINREFGTKEDVETHNEKFCLN